MMIFSCSQEKGNIDQVEKEVFAIHDEVMPKMGQIMDLRNALSQKIVTIDSLLKIKNEDSLQQQKDQALTLSNALQQADEGMMNWMHAYNGDSLKALSGDEALKALNAEKTKISQVRDQMLESITKAEAFLKK
ncbi:viral A-type inclusion protein [Runella zeae]|uniref:viral A-type inclusion protein n=1 Tax=Runella zeae TaxID=94255 RepID=UPI0012F8F556|nr:viral A-type inclusion protein [Runella zeae]